MNIILRNIKVSELVADYEDKAEEGVLGYGGRLNIRPPYQREFVYEEKQRNEVIHTVRKNFPLNTMYWVKAGDNFELMDGQQRTISICQYISGDFSVVIDGATLGFNNLPKNKQQEILDYEISVYVCEGTDSEKLDWFRIINIAGKPLTNQELRNAIYTGPWLSDAKRWFSKTGAPAVQEGREKLVKGTPIRQEVLELALDWLSDSDIEGYMSAHQHDMDAQELWQYWQEVFDWVSRIFPKQDSARTRLMKGLPWGRLYNKYKNKPINAVDAEKRIVDLIEDDEIENPKGIYTYIVTGNEKTLNLRTFDEKLRQKLYSQQSGICKKCNDPFELDQMHADHIKPWSKGGKTILANGQMLCSKCNLDKSDK
ncbi:DUF262 domain-containing protein [Paraperlucidibaca sp.]|uniref:HNH endonuclease family protein n=1 Tax=Paraperlucidibaca sp. TaxID=2708021 RepID=UPI0030F45FEF